MTRRQAAREYLSSDYYSSATGVSAEQRKVHHETMRSLEERYPGIREQAIAGQPRHFDRPLSTNERSHQRYMQEREKLDTPELATLRRNLDDADRARPRASSGGGESGAPARRTPPPPRRPSPTRPPTRNRARNAAASARRAVAASPISPPASVKGIGSMITTAASAGVAFSMLYLLLQNGKAAGGIIGGAGQAFDKLVSPQPFFGSSTSSPGPTGATGVTGAANAYLAAPATGVVGELPAATPGEANSGVVGTLPGATAGAGVAASPIAAGRNTAGIKTSSAATGSPSSAAVNAAAASEGLHYDAALNEYVG